MLKTLFLILIMITLSTISKKCGKKKYVILHVYVVKEENKETQES